MKIIFPSAILGVLRTLIRFWLRHRFQALLCLLGVSTGVAVFTAIQVANGSALAAFAESMTAMTGQDTHRVSAEGGGTLEESLFPALATHPQVIAATPLLQTSFQAQRGKDAPPLKLTALGLDLVGDAVLRAYSFPGATREGNPPWEALLAGSDGVLVPRGLAGLLGLREGGVLEGLGPTGPVRMRVLGIFDPPSERAVALSRTVVMDIAAHQELFEKLGRLDSIGLVVAEGGESALRGFLPPGVTMESAGTRVERATRMSRAFRLNLTTLGLFALLVAGFLIFNAASFAVVQRASTVAILRCLGASSATVLVALCAEAAGLGLVGAMGGLALGWWWGGLMLRNTGATFFEVILQSDPLPATVHLSPSLAWGALALGVGVALAGAALPAWQASRISPLSAVRHSRLPLATGGRMRRWVVPGLAILALGALLLLWPTRSLVAALLGALSIALGAACLTPGMLLIVGRFGAPLLGWLAGTPGRLAARNLVRSLPRTGLAAAALMVALSLALAVEITVRSFRHTFTLWLEQAVTADVYVTPEPGAGKSLDPAMVEKMRNLPGVAGVAVLRSRRVVLGERNILVLGIDLPDFFHHATLPSRDGTREEIIARTAGGAALLSEALAYHLDLARGDTLSLPTPLGPRDFAVGAVVQNYSDPQGIVYLANDRYQAVFGKGPPASAGIWISPEPGEDQMARVSANLAALPGAQRVRLTPNREIRGEALRVFDRTFLITDVMGTLAAGVAFIAVVSALAALLEERTRILGVLRAIGVTRGGLALSLALEAGLLAGSAAVVSWGVGPATAAAVVFVINRRAFGWTLQYLPWEGSYAGLLMLALGAAWLGSAYPIWRATRLSAAATLREE